MREGQQVQGRPERALGACRALALALPAVRRRFLPAPMPRPAGSGRAKSGSLPLSLSTDAAVECFIKHRRTSVLNSFRGTFRSPPRATIMVVSQTRPHEHRCTTPPIDYLLRGEHCPLRPRNPPLHDVAGTEGNTCPLLCPHLPCDPRRQRSLLHRVADRGVLGVLFRGAFAPGAQKRPTIRDESASRIANTSNDTSDGARINSHL